MGNPSSNRDRFFPLLGALAVMLIGIAAYKMSLQYSHPDFGFAFLGFAVIAAGALMILAARKTWNQEGKLTGVVRRELIRWGIGGICLGITMQLSFSNRLAQIGATGALVVAVTFGFGYVVMLWYALDFILWRIVCGWRVRNRTLESAKDGIIRPTTKI